MSRDAWSSVVDSDDINLLAGRVLRLARQADLPRQSAVQVRPLRKADIPVLDLAACVEVDWRADSVVAVGFNVKATILLEGDERVPVRAGVEGRVGDIRYAVQ